MSISAHDAFTKPSSRRHDDVTKWKHFPRCWPFVRGIHRWPVNSPHKGQWRWALVFSLICAWINGWVNNRETGDLRRHRAHYDVTVMENGWNSKWRPHDMGNFFALLVLYEGKTNDHLWFTLTKGLSRGLWYFLCFQLNALKDKQARCQWFETPCCIIYGSIYNLYFPARRMILQM